MKKILVIEDEIDLARLLDLRLSKEGFIVFIANTGEEGVKRAQEMMPDLILLDLILPGIYGLAVLKELKLNERTQRIPVLILTSMHNADYSHKIMEEGVAGYLQKPCDPEILMEKIQGIVTERV